MDKYILGVILIVFSFTSLLIKAADLKREEMLKYQYFGTPEINRSVPTETTRYHQQVFSEEVLVGEVTVNKFIQSLPKKIIKEMCKVTNGGSLRIWGATDAHGEFVLAKLGGEVGIEFNIKCNR